MAQEVMKISLIPLTLLIPCLIVSLSVWLISKPWFVHFEYQRIPREQGSFSDSERTRLGLLGLSSVLPGGNGCVALRGAKLSSGEPAFTKREIDHMADVQTLFDYMRMFLIIFSILAIAYSLIRFMPSNEEKEVPSQIDYQSVINDYLRAIQYGALLTLLLLALFLAATYFDFDELFMKFHHLFFKSDSFLFNPNDTLIKLYPEQFWQEAAVLVSLLSVGISCLVLFLCSYPLHTMQQNASE